MLMPRIKRYQKKFLHSYSYGAYPTLDLLKYRKEKVLKVLVKKEGLKSSGVEEIVELCKKDSISFEVNDKSIERIAVKENTYVVGLFEKYVTELEEDNNHIVLVEPSNMGNVGTIIRTMLGFNFKNLAVIKPAVDIFDPMVVRSTMGAIFRINFKYYENIGEYMSEFPEYTYYPFMLNGKNNIKDVEFKEPFAIIQGNESKGLGQGYENIGESVYIPHNKDIDSLNLSVATGIGMWEAFRKDSGSN